MPEFNKYCREGIFNAIEIDFSDVSSGPASEMELIGLRLFKSIQEILKDRFKIIKLSEWQILLLSEDLQKYMATLEWCNCWIDIWATDEGTSIDELTIFIQRKLDAQQGDAPEPASTHFMNLNVQSPAR